MSPPSVTLALLAALVLIYHVGVGFYFARGQEPPPAFDLLYRVGLLCSVVWWLRSDGRRHGVAPVYCLGLLASVGWMFLIPYHLLKTRGLKGLAATLGLLGAFVAAQFVAVVAYLIFSAAG